VSSSSSSSSSEGNSSSSSSEGNSSSSSSSENYSESTSSEGYSSESSSSSEGTSSSSSSEGNSSSSSSSEGTSSSSSSEGISSESSSSSIDSSSSSSSEGYSESSSSSNPYLGENPGVNIVLSWNNTSHPGDKTFLGTDWLESEQGTYKTIEPGSYANPATSEQWNKNTTQGYVPTWYTGSTTVSWGLSFNIKADTSGAGTGPWNPAQIRGVTIVNMLPYYAKNYFTYSNTFAVVYPTWAGWANVTPSTWGLGNSIADEQFGGSYTFGSGPLNGVTVTWTRGPDGTVKSWKA